MKMHIDLLGLT